MIIQNTWYLVSYNQADGVFLDVPHFATSVYKYTKHFGLSFAYDAPRFRMICLMMYIQPLLSTHSETNSKPISLHKHIHPNFCFCWYLSVALTPAMSQVNDYSFLIFCLVQLESVFRWRLSTIKILLQLKLTVLSNIA